MEEALKFSGMLTLEMRRDDGSRERRTVLNLITTAGLNWIMSRMTGTPNAMSFIAVGTGTTAPALGNTVLASEVTRQAASASTSGSATIYSATFGAGIATGALTEAGIFNASSAGTMLARATFAPYDKGASDILTIDWTITGS